jgi:hypothetical protein
LFANILGVVKSNKLPEIVRWSDWSGSGLEHVSLVETTEFTEAHSVTIAGRAPDGFAAIYSARLDSDWRVLEVQASVLGTAESIHLRRNEQGEWFDGNERQLRDLRGAFDVDLSITPLTNTFPIRRLSLAVGDSAEITTAYIAFPGLTVSPDPQRYTRLSSDRYKYEALDTDFVREITVDEHGLVATYPDFFRRIC